MKLQSPYELFENNIGLVNLAMRRFKNRNDDLYQSGLMGLFKAALKYNQSLGYRFSTYAIPIIVNEMKNELKNGLLVRIPDEVFRVLNYLKANEKYAIEKIMKETNTTKKNVIDALYFKSFLIFDEQIYLSEKEQLFIYLNDLTIEERKINYLYYYHNLYQYDIAKIMNVSPTKVSRVLNNSLNKIKNNLYSK